MTILSQAEIAAARADLLALNADVANATLTQITGPGVPDGYGDPGPGPNLWTGTAKGTLSRERHDEITDGEQVPVKLDTFKVPGDAWPALEVAGPDWQATTVTIRDERTTSPITRVFTVTAMEHGRHGITNNVVLTLDETRV